MMMEPISTKELDYVTDSMSNEDLIIKQCAVLAASTQQNATHSLCMDIINVHSHHYNTLMQTLHQHVPMAPTQNYN